MNLLLNSTYNGIKNNFTIQFYTSSWKPLLQEIESQTKPIITNDNFNLNTLELTINSIHNKTIKQHLIIFRNELLQNKQLLQSQNSKILSKKHQPIFI